MCEINILDSAIEELSKLDKTIARRIVKRINWLAENFDNIQVEILTSNLAGFYKLRIGDYRLIYEVFREIYR